MSPSEALETIRGYAVARRIRVTVHAYVVAIEAGVVVVTVF